MSSVKLPDEAGRALRQVARAAVARSLRRVWLSRRRRYPHGPVVAGPVIAYVASYVVDQSVETYRVATGAIGRREYVLRSRRLALETAGAAGGTWAGAVMGTLVLPGLGTAVGSLAGGYLGGAGAVALNEALLQRDEAERGRALSP